jgi:hypothetical protein
MALSVVLAFRAAATLRTQLLALGHGDVAAKPLRKEVPGRAT